MNKSDTNPLASKMTVVMRYMLFLIIISLTISLVRSILKITKANTKLQDVKNKIISLKQQNQDLQGQISYTQSDFYVEQQARDKLGLAKPGEIVLVLPSEDKLKTLTDQISEETLELPLSNWKKWGKVFKLDL